MSITFDETLAKINLDQQRLAVLITD